MASQRNTSRSPPLLDFAAFYDSDPAKKQALVGQIRDCCLHNGFFQITNHPVPLELQERIMAWNKAFFDLPLEAKKKVGKENNSWNRGYELLRSQILEEGTLPELKEGFYVGDEIPVTHPYFVNKKLNSGPNQWPAPDTFPGVDDFRRTCMAYYHAVVALAKDILKAIALSLDLGEDHFDDFATGAVATMRLLHYPPTEKGDGDEKLRRGIGAHTDFGAVTLLLQDDVDGLQVWDSEVRQWFDVLPVKGALVVNLGNLMMRWSNDRYVSNTHRVINRSGTERYSIPVFFSGNPDYTIECLPNCRESEHDAPKYPPITVEDAVGGSYRESYGRAEKWKQDEEEKKKRRANAAGSLEGVAPAVAVA
ncbi:1-aminocyclopropane-1-carboxylate oxidase [Diplodia corticola]|uniref:1-aminocyclopropane-1-carboxylate oxidase n=1 Tax=Diplodia corticola TaxID=236234 RepID=A0A1J9QKS5_9PEZI|nr:1-aminocyclopropane-1-carboxylate oxidase [Diplodia corticola]OJD29073.1 1-aminocyclopropane-1-carboxylate oxidase [Diplodia corticola]